MRPAAILVLAVAFTLISAPTALGADALLPAMEPAVMGHHCQPDPLDPEQAVQCAVLKVGCLVAETLLGLICL